MKDLTSAAEDEHLEAVEAELAWVNIIIVETANLGEVEAISTEKLL